MSKISQLVVDRIRLLFLYREKEGLDTFWHELKHEYLTLTLIAAFLHVCISSNVVFFKDLVSVLTPVGNFELKWKLYVTCKTLNIWKQIKKRMNIAIREIILVLLSISLIHMDAFLSGSIFSQSLRTPRMCLYLAWCLSLSPPIDLVVFRANKLFSPVLFPPWIAVKSTFLYFKRSKNIHKEQGIFRKK